MKASYELTIKKNKNIVNDQILESTFLSSCDHKFDSEFCTECGQRKRTVTLKTEVCFEIGLVLGNSIESIQERFSCDGEFDPLSEKIKWNSPLKDMCTISKKFPNLFFILKKSGDNPEDSWKAYFKNGIRFQILT